MVRALKLTNTEQFNASVTKIPPDELPSDNVTVAIEHSTLNFKDALALTSSSPVVRKWPMVAGIDGAGVVIESTDSRWKQGDRVVHNGWGAGETKWGCFSELAALNADQLVALPDRISTKHAMAIGTAGYTAMLCVLALEDHGLSPSSGEILVTGATGGRRQREHRVAWQTRLPA